MLMNYERTVADFGRCKRSVSIMYGFHLVGRCVGSDYKGPCKVSISSLECSAVHQAHRLLCPAHSTLVDALLIVYLSAEFCLPSALW